MGPYLPDPNDTFEPDLHFDSFDCTWTFGPNPFEGADLSLDWPSPPRGVRVVGFPWSDYAGHSCSRHGRISHLKSIQNQNIINCTVFENHRKSLIQHCERSELSLYFEWTKCRKCQKWHILASFIKAEACGQTELPDRSVVIGQKVVENAKIQM